jgi:hypothetical protein
LIHRKNLDSFLCAPERAFIPRDEIIQQRPMAREWAVQRARYMTLETMAALSDDPVVGLPAMAI